jgi:hypothetical protein
VTRHCFDLNAGLSKSANDGGKLDLKRIEPQRCASVDWDGCPLSALTVFAVVTTSARDYF